MREDVKATMKNTMIRKGFIAAIPLILSYIPVAVTYGVIAQQSGLTFLEIMMMSVFIYAGAGQFMAVQMFVVGAGAIEMIIAIFILNFRHFIMSFSLMNFLRHIPLRFKAPLTLGLTDETFAVASMNKKEAEKDQGIFFYIVLFLSSYLAWILGSAIGVLLGDIIPKTLSDSMQIGLYAMFIGLLIPSVRKHWKLGIISLCAMLVNSISSLFLSSGWSIVMGTIIGGFSGIFILKDDEL